MSSREVRKTTMNRGPRIRIPAAKDVVFPSPRMPLRKEVASVSDPTGELPRELSPPSQPVFRQRSRDEKTVTVKEAAFRLGKSPDAVYQWLRSGRLRGRQPGGRCCAIMVLESSIEEALLCTFERAG
jgi:excisionase family DNA binding protein